MGNEDRNRMEQRGSERLILLIFSVYALTISTSAFRAGWLSWVPVVMLFAVGCAWFLHIIEYKNFTVRAIVTTVLIEVVIFLYGINSPTYEQVLPTFFAMAILIALYGMPDCMYITMVSIVLITVNALFFKETGGKYDDEFTQVLRQAFTVITFEVIVTFWVEKRQQSVRKTTEVIAALKRAEHSKDDFLANVSHEIRTPLNTIMGMSEIILQEQDLNRVKENVYQIQSAGRTLMSTVSDILDFSELQSENITIEEEVYHISSTVQDIVNMAVAQKNGKNLELIVNMDPMLPRTLWGDEKKIRRAVMNLVNNAIKFTDSGYVGIKITSRRESYGINLVFTVTDTGIGMEEENVEKLFTSFNQVDTKRNRQEGGVGLGLAISKLIVEKMGGVITVRSKPGKGSSIRLVIPQKVLYDAPAVELEELESIHALAYVNVERFGMSEIRDAYQDNIFGMVAQMGVDCHMCRNLEELKRRFERGEHNYVFTSWMEYSKDKDFFDSLADKTQVVVIVDPEQGVQITHPAVVKMYKPCYVLPLAALRNQKPAEVISTEVSGSKKNSFVAPDAHILVVDDNQMNIRVVEGLLSRYQIKVTQALSGAEALDKIESQDYDFVFMDHMMPEMDGVETAHRIWGKIGSYFQSVPIIALTANAVAGSREMFLREGFADFIEKPVELSVLDRVLRRNLPEEKIITKTIPMVKEEKVMAINPQKQGDEAHLEEAEESGELKIGDLNVKNALLYCGSEEGYLFILAECCRNYQETAGELNQLFADANWKNYGIKIHALKSTMRSIGADACADLAYQLEMAAKQEQYDVIYEHHEEVMQLYKETMLLIAKHSKVDADESLIVATGNVVVEEHPDMAALEELTEDQIKQCAMDFEAAMYSLDRATMEMILDQLENGQFKQVALKSKLDKVRRKVEQADYFSAGEVLAQVIGQLSK